MLRPPVRACAVSQTHLDCRPFLPFSHMERSKMMFPCLFFLVIVFHLSISQVSHSFIFIPYLARSRFILAPILLSHTIIFSFPKPLSLCCLLISSFSLHKCSYTIFYIILVFNLIFSAYSLHLSVSAKSFILNSILLSHSFALNSNILLFSHILFSPFSYLHVSIFSRSHCFYSFIFTASQIILYSIFFSIFSFLSLCSHTLILCHIMSHFSLIHFHTSSVVILPLIL